MDQEGVMATYDEPWAYRERRKRDGMKETLIALPTETLELLERFQEARGYANSGETLNPLVQTVLEALKREGMA